MGLSQFSHEKLWKYWETAFFDQRKKRLKITKETLTPHPVLWSRSNLDRFRLPAPDNNIFVKSAVLKTKVNNLVFFKCAYFFF